MQIKVKYLADLSSDVLSDDTDPEYGFRYVDIGSVDLMNGIQVPDSETKFANAPSRARRIAKSGDVVVSMVRTYLRAIAVVPPYSEDLVFSTGFAVLRARDGVDNQYLGYACKSHRFVDEVASRSVGVSYPAVNAWDIGEIKIDRPDINEQRRIAEFLNRKTIEIDHASFLHKKQLNLLKEREKSFVISSTSPLVDSYWKKTQIRRILKKRESLPVDSSGVVTAFRNGVVDLRSRVRADGYTLSGKEDGYQEVESGDLVFHGLDGFAGAVGISRSSGKCSPVYHVCESLDGVDLRFVAYGLRSMGFTGFLSTQAPSVRQRAVDFRNWENFGQLPIYLPSLDVQRKISDELDEGLAASILVEEKLQRQVNLLAERRQALITAAVTGQIDVTTARGADLS